jgi:hypothetical protein
MIICDGEVGLKSVMLSKGDIPKSYDFYSWGYSRPGKWAAFEMIR